MQREPHNHDEAQVSGSSRGPGIGQVLARARMAQGLSLEDVAGQLKFGARQLEALEQERFNELPGSTFARGMVRGYARLLKLDAEPLLAQLEGRFEIPDANRLLARYRQPVPFSNQSRRSNVAYAVLSIAVLVVVAAVAFEWQHERSNAARLPFVPAARAPQEPSGPSVASTAPATPTTPQASEPGPAAVSAPPVPARAAAVPVKPLAEIAPKAPAESAATPAKDVAPKTPADTSGPRVVFRFEEQSWVEVYDSTGRTLMAQLNPAGSVRVVRGEPPFSLVIGNAQHVQVVYGNKIVDLTPHTRVEVARLKLE
jgi:cytoskeleton protein RodZ